MMRLDYVLHFNIYNLIIVVLSKYDGKTKHLSFDVKYKKIKFEKWKYNQNHCYNIIIISFTYSIGESYHTNYNPIVRSHATIQHAMIVDLVLVQFDLHTSYDYFFVPCQPNSLPPLC